MILISPAPPSEGDIPCRLCMNCRHFAPQILEDFYDAFLVQSMN